MYILDALFRVGLVALFSLHVEPFVCCLLFCLHRFVDLFHFLCVCLTCDFRCVEGGGAALDHGLGMTLVASIHVCWHFMQG